MRVCLGQGMEWSSSLVLQLKYILVPIFYMWKTGNPLLYKISLSHMFQDYFLMTMRLFYFFPTLTLLMVRPNEVTKDAIYRRMYLWLEQME